ncbi:MAG: prepilin peptidase, partial [Haloechinothrix sp.]
MLVALFFALGLIFGSFLAVVIGRLPRGESIVRPRSRCPACGAEIRARDNIPVVSWLLLRGRCRACGARISVEYPLTELATGALFAAAAGLV